MRPVWYWPKHVMCGEELSITALFSEGCGSLVAHTHAINDYKEQCILV